MAKNLSKKLYNLFFVEDSEEKKLKEGDLTEPPKKSPKAVSDLLEGEKPVFEGTFPISESSETPGEIDFQAIFSNSGISTHPFPVEKAYEMIKELPESTPLEDKRANVKIVLKATGVNIQDILKDAVQKVRALEGYLEAGERELNETQQEADKAIDLLEKEIESWKKKVKEKKMEQYNLELACEEKSKQFEEVVDFFTLDKLPEDEQKEIQEEPPEKKEAKKENIDDIPSQSDINELKKLLDET